jgi:drug/metabolite transporter (DMT)-like permease
MPSASHRPDEPRALVIAAFAAVYVIWGSTYLFIHFAVSELPPFLVGAVRFLVAGSILTLWAHLRDDPRPTGRQARTAAIGGLFLLTVGNGAVVWAVQRVPSGITALIVATLPVWMVLIEWARPGGVRPRAGVFAGIALGLAGIALLLDPGALGGGERVDIGGALVLCLGSMAWAAGSIFMRHFPMPRSARAGNGIQMLAGGAGLALLGLSVGEASQVDVAGASARALLSVLYLMIFGSLIGFTAYTYILRVSTPARVSTYAYVNPLVAVFLGWMFAGEAVTGRTLAAAAVILASVAVVTIWGTARRQAGGVEPVSGTAEARAADPA